MPAPDLTSTAGVWLICAFVQAILQGCGLLQAFLYFVWYPKDPMTIKLTVVLLVILQCIQMTAAIANVYNWFITGFGDFVNLNTIHVADMTELVALFLSIFVAQAHFARCIYQLMERSIILPLSIFILAFAALGTGMGQVYHAIHLKFYSNLGNKTLEMTSNLQAGLALGADLLITVGLCWRLNKGRTGIQSSNRVINFLVMTAINRGVFTMFFAALDIILFTAKPGTFYFMIGFLVSDKLYMNSMLAILNTRQYASDLRTTTVVSSSLTPMNYRPGASGVRSPMPNRMSGTAGTVTATVVTETYRGPDELGLANYEQRKLPPHPDF